jgi:hypothetical protein
VSFLLNFVGAFLGGGVIGAIVGAIVTHVFVESRDRRNRRIEFLNKMGEWRTRVYRSQVAGVIADDFPKDVARFGGEYVALESDLLDSQARHFHKLCDEIVAMKDSELAEVPTGDLAGKAKLLQRIEEIIKFVQVINEQSEWRHTIKARLSLRG